MNPDPFTRVCQHITRPMVGEATLRAELRRQVRQEGSIAALARKWGVSASLISEVMKGRHRVSERMARRAGFRKVVRWERIT